MATIVQRYFNSVPKRALMMSSVADGVSGVAEVLSRPFYWGSNWQVVRMGILCSIAEHPSQSYDRHFGYYWGCCSGSRTIFDGVADTTCIGFAQGNVLTYWSFSDEYTTLQEHSNTGSFFFFDTYAIEGHMNGGASTGTGASFGYLSIVNSGDSHKRRSILMLELSASLDGNVHTTMYGMFSGSMAGKYANKDYTEEDLKAILTSSVFPTASGVPMDALYRTMAFDTASYPLESAFIGYYGDIPFEIYDWYVYKVK